MKKIIVLLAALGAFGTALAQVSVSVGINQPGVYGRINIGDLPRPALVMPQPVIIAQPRERYERRPIYLYVPPAHQRDWRRYCGRYAACGQPVYFVRDEWVRERYSHEHPGWNRGGRRDDDRHHGRERRHDRHDEKGHGRGHGRGNGHGHGHGHGH